ncbi:MAG: aminotransferase class I/II-fold pyridoxal phosphate-dependent enzyme [Candidatus Actinomarina sp.]|jgi:alanine-synthesizing transaminase|nr:aminotransferase class I/II-fold pyridoxal phosphate-dependent enzyme [Candidatus Actinomarina sp.]|tara:strand:+ start:502 stop:1677 length:1176 start_codon:yes stop_codon:yes gene_type:complete
MSNFSNNLVNNFPEYLFNEINNQKLQARKNGRDVIDLGYGNPDIPTHTKVVDKLIESAQNKKNHKYSVSKGIHGLRSAMRDKYMRVYDVDLHEDQNIVNTIGSKEGLTHLLMSVLDKGDNIVVPDPSYPIHHFAPLIAGGNPIKIKCLDPEEFLNSLIDVLKTTDIKVVLISFPHNPTTITVTKDFYDKLVSLAQKYNFLIINDFAYSDVYFNEERPPSLLQSDKELGNSVELYSLTKGYSMAGWRVGFALGNKEAIQGLTKLKSYIDYGTFQPIQIASTVAINELDEYPLEVSEIYRERKNIVSNSLESLGFEVYKSNATMFVWAKIPYTSQKKSMDFSLAVLEKSNVALSPGLGFGSEGEGYIRIALVENKQRIRQAMKNMQVCFDDII